MRGGGVVFLLKNNPSPAIAGAPFTQGSLIKPFASVIEVMFFLTVRFGGSKLPPYGIKIFLGYSGGGERVTLHKKIFSSIKRQTVMPILSSPTKE